jgi:hypothetical protein
MAWTIGQFGDTPSERALRAFLDGYRAEAGYLPALDVTSFSAGVSAWMNYVYGQICKALEAKGADDRDFMNRHVSHMLAHAPSRAFLARVVEMAMAPT